MAVFGFSFLTPLIKAEDVAVLPGLHAVFGFAAFYRRFFGFGGFFLLLKGLTLPAEMRQLVITSPLTPQDKFIFSCKWLVKCFNFFFFVFFLFCLPIAASTSL